MTDLADARLVAVTGASGFIGARLVALMREGAVPFAVRPLSRPRPGVADGVDLTNAASVAQALTGCHALVHCAFDFSDPEANVAIARTLAAECAAAGVRFVQVSTAAVYEPFPDGDLDETVTVAGPGSSYKQAKLAIEREVLRLVQRAGLQAVILQPTVVYGPNGRAWTDSPIRELLTGTVVLPDRGDGLCNAVHVDDVCQAILAAVRREVPAGERILVSGPGPVAWREFYTAYGDMLGLPPPVLLPPAADASLDDDDAVPRAPSALTRLKRIATRRLGSGTMAQANLLLNFVRGLLHARQHVATGAKLALFRSRCRIRTGKARDLLGFEPRFDLRQGMEATQPYVQGRYGRLARIKRRR